MTSTSQTQPNHNNFPHLKIPTINPQTIYSWTFPVTSYSVQLVAERSKELFYRRICWSFNSRTKSLGRKFSACRQESLCKCTLMTGQGYRCILRCWTVSARIKNCSGISTHEFPSTTFTYSTRPTEQKPSPHSLYNT